MKTNLDEMWELLLTRVKELFSDPRKGKTGKTINLPGEPAPWAYAICELIVQLDIGLENMNTELRKKIDRHNGRIRENHKYTVGVKDRLRIVDECIGKINDRQDNRITKMENRLALDDGLLNKIIENVNLLFDKLKSKEPSSEKPLEISVSRAIEKKKYEYIKKNRETPNGLVLDHRSFYQLEKEIINSEKQKLSQYVRANAFGMEIFVVNRNETIIIPFKNSDA